MSIYKRILIIGFILGIGIFFMRDYNIGIMYKPYTNDTREHSSSTGDNTEFKFYSDKKFFSYEKCMESHVDTSMDSEFWISGCDKKW